MNRFLTLGTITLALAALASSCTTTGGSPSRGPRVYLVGVAGGG